MTTKTAALALLAALLGMQSADDLRQRGIERLAAGEVQSALDALEQSVAAAPDDQRNRYHLGRALLVAGEWVRAWESFETVLAAQPELRPAAFFMAEICYQVGGVDRARQRLDALAEITPRWPDPEVRAAELALEVGDGTAAANWLDRALAIAPDRPGLWMRRGEAAAAAFDLEAAEHAYRRALELAPDSATARAALAYELFNQQRFADAAAELGPALAHSPRDPSLLLPYAEAKLYLGDADAAAGAVATAMTELEMRDTAGLERLRIGALELSARIGLKLGDLAGAEADARVLVQLDPKHVQGRFLLGSALHRQGDASGAEQLAEFKRLSDAREHRELGDEYLRVASDPVAAGREYEIALRIDPDDQVARRGLARARLATDDPAGALELLETLSGDDAGSESVPLRILALWNSGRREEARTLWAAVGPDRRGFPPEVRAAMLSHLPVCPAT